MGDATHSRAARDIVVCCDGTSNEIEGNLSNVLKLYRITHKSNEQLVFYDPGVGTIGLEKSWGRLWQRVTAVWGLAWLSNGERHFGLTKLVRRIGPHSSRATVLPSPQAV